MNIDIQQLKERGVLAWDLALQYLPVLLQAIIVLRVGLKVITWASTFVEKGLTKAKIDTTIRKFTVSLINILLKIFLLISVAGIFGIPTTSFIALIGAAGLAIGLSLQGSLANFAGGVLILVLKPYKIGDIVAFQGVKGKVEHIGVFSTTITTIERNTVIIPNGPIINNNITNLSSNPLARVDVQVGISYDADIDQARSVLLDVLTNNAYIIAAEPKEVLVEGLGASSVDLVVRGYTKDGNYFNAFYTLTEEVKKGLDAANIDIPYPHRVVHTVKA